MKRIIIAAVLALTTATAGAQDDGHLRLHFDFSQVEGTSVKAAAGGVTARLMGVAKVEEVGSYHVLNLGNTTGYLNLTANTGAIIKTLGLRK